MTHRKILNQIKIYIVSDLADIIEDYMMDFRCKKCDELFWNDGNGMIHLLKCCAYCPKSKYRGISRDESLHYIDILYNK